MFLKKKKRKQKRETTWQALSVIGWTLNYSAPFWLSFYVEQYLLKALSAQTGNPPPAATVNGNIRPVQPVWPVHGQLDSAALVQRDTEPPWQASRMAKHTAGGMLGASPACVDVLQKQPHRRVGGGLFKDGFTFSLTCKRVGMCQACLQLAAATFGMRNDLWHSSASYILFLHSWSVSRPNSDCVTISQNKNQSPSLSTSLVPIFQRWCCFFRIHIYSQADKNVKFLCSVFSSCSGNWVEYCSVWYRWGGSSMCSSPSAVCDSKPWRRRKLQSCRCQVIYFFELLKIIWQWL